MHDITVITVFFCEREHSALLDNVSSSLLLVQWGGPGSDRPRLLKALDREALRILLDTVVLKHLSNLNIDVKVLMFSIAGRCHMILNGTETCRSHNYVVTNFVQILTAFYQPLQSRMPPPRPLSCGTGLLEKCERTENNLGSVTVGF